MNMVQKYAKECINANDARLMTEALNEFIKNQTKIGGYQEDINSAMIAKKAIDFVLDRASFEHDEICFYVSVGTKKRD